MTPRTFRSLFCLLFLFLLSANTSQAQKTYRKALEEILQKHEGVGLAVAVVKNGKLVYTESVGWKNLETHTPLEEKDLFRIASISKSFTATAIMQLVEKGFLRLDDELGQWLGFPIRNPAFPDEPITLRMALSHTSGLNDSQGYFLLDVIDPSKGKEWQKCYQPAKPGTAYLYCNLNYNLLGAIIEKATGKRFDKYIVEEILQPLGISGGYEVATLPAERLVTLYTYDKEKNEFSPSTAAYDPRTNDIAHYQLGYSTPVFSPTGGMKISAADLATYMIMHINQGNYHKKRIISKKSAGLMQTPGLANYGLALSQSTQWVNGLTLTGHTGSAYGLNSVMFFDPHQKAGVVVITNGSNTGATNGINHLLSESFRLLYQEIILPKGK